MRILLAIVGSLLALQLWANHPYPSRHGAALLIANWKYDDTPLKTPPQDVKAVASALQDKGLHTTIVENLTHENSFETIQQFSRTIPTKGTALIYFSGYLKHSRQQHILAPAGKPHYRDNESSIHRILDHLEKTSGAAQQILILDGQYELPKSFNIKDPLEAPQDLPPNSWVIYSQPFGTREAPPESGQSKFSQKLVSSLRNESILEAALKSASSNQFSTIKDSQSPNQSFLKGVAPPNQVKEGRRPGDEWVNPNGLVFCWIPSGKVTIGSPESSKVREPDEVQTEVSFEKGFWMAKYEFTRIEFTSLFEYPSLRGTYLSTGKSKFHPMNKMRAQNPTEWLTKLNTSVPKGWEYDLPTEAEWEYAARAGSQTEYYFGEDASQLQKHGNFADQSLRSSHFIGEVGQNWNKPPQIRSDLQTGLFSYAHKTWTDGFPDMAQVGQFPPNPWGLHDIHGNLAELTSTPYTPDRSMPEKFDINAPLVTKGGSWLSTPQYCRSAFRGMYSHKTREGSTENYVGIRFILRRKQ